MHSTRVMFGERTEKYVGAGRRRIEGDGMPLTALDQPRMSDDARVLDVEPVFIVVGSDAIRQYALFLTGFHQDPVVPYFVFRIGIVHKAEFDLGAGWRF